MTNPPTPSITVPLHSRRHGRAIQRQVRVQLFQKLQHAIPASALFAAGLQGLGDATGLGLVIAWAELLAGGAVVVLMARAVRAHRKATHQNTGGHHAHAGVDWLDIGVAAVLAVEVWEHWHVTHHIRRPTVLMSLVVLVQGLTHGRFAHFTRRPSQLQITEHGVEVGRAIFRRFRARWEDLADVTLTDTTATLRRRDGRTRTINLADLENADEVRSALEDAQRRLPGGAASPIISR